MEETKTTNVLVRPSVTSNFPVFPSQNVLGRERWIHVELPFPAIQNQLKDKIT